MHVDLIEALRCPASHSDGWLVARADVVVDRRIVQGTVGCPTCGAEWPIADGALHFAERPSPVSALEGAHTAAPRAEALRTAALLDLRDATGVVLLAGAAASIADALVAMTGVLVLVVNAPPGVALAHSRLVVRDALPLGVGTLRGAHLDVAHADGAWMTSASRAVQRMGRIMAPVECAPPGEVAGALRELARDEREWVAEVQVAASGLVPLRRG